MSTPPSPPQGTSAAFVVPPETEQKFSEIVSLIRASESMNDEERQYWINILPIMTPEQVDNLRKILTTERDQLSAIDRKYSKEISSLGQEEVLRRAEELRRSKRKERTEQEQASEEAEDTTAEDLLRKIEVEGA